MEKDIQYLEDNISFVSGKLEEIDGLLKNSSNNLSYLFQSNVLKSQLTELQGQLYKQKILREKEILELRLLGKSASYGTLPATIIGGLTTNFSNAILSSSRKKMFGENKVKNIAEKVNDKINLRIEGLGIGSTIIYLSANNSPEPNGWSVTEEVLNNTFSLLKSNDNEELSEMVSEFGVKGIKPLSGFLSQLNKDELEINLSWQTPTETTQFWEGNRQEITRIKKFLTDIIVLPPEEIDITGTLVTISLKKKFELITDDGKSFAGSFPSELLKTMEYYHINETISATLVKTTIQNPFTHKEKVEYSLKSIGGF